MEVDDLIQSQVSKFQKISCNGGLQKASLQNPNRIENGNGINSGLQNQNLVFPVVDGAGAGGGGGGGGGGGWPSSRIVRVSRGSGGKDRHSKVLTSKGLRDRRIRLSVTTAIEFYDLQDRLGYDQPSKAVDWLIKAALSSISELPSLPPSFSGDNHHHYEKRFTVGDRNHQSKSPACSSTSETSKGSGLSLSRSENRILARDRARDRSTAAKQEKEKEKARVPLPTVMNTVNNSTNTSVQNSSFTYLLTGGINNANPSESRIHWTSPTDANYFQNMSHVNIDTESQHNHFPFQTYALPLATIGGNEGQSCYNLNSPMGSLSSSLSLSSRGGLASGSSRGTLQSNLLSMADGSASASFPLFVVPNTISGPPDHFVATEYESQRLQLYGRGDGRMRQSDQYKERSRD